MNDADGFVTDSETGLDGIFTANDMNIGSTNRVRRTWIIASPGPAMGTGFSSSPNFPTPRKTLAFIKPSVSRFFSIVTGSASVWSEIVLFLRCSLPDRGTGG